MMRVAESLLRASRGFAESCLLRVASRPLAPHGGGSSRLATRPDSTLPTSLPFKTFHVISCDLHVSGVCSHICLAVCCSCSSIAEKARSSSSGWLAARNRFTQQIQPTDSAKKINAAHSHVDVFGTVAVHACSSCNCLFAANLRFTDGSFVAMASHFNSGFFLDLLLFTMELTTHTQHTLHNTH